MNSGKRIKLSGLLVTNYELMHSLKKLTRVFGSKLILIMKFMRANVKKLNE